MRPTIRLRLTLIFGGLFIGASVLLLALTYVLISHALTPVTVDPDLINQRSGDQTAIDEQVVVARSEERAAALGEVLTQSIIALVATAGVAVILGWVMAGRVLRPIRKITAHAMQASEATLEQRIGLVGPPDELKELADTFDGMLERLEAAFTSQRRFSSQVSHELRTPLAIIRAEAEVALASPDVTERELRLSRAVLAASERSERLIDGLLALARSESMLREDRRIDLADLVGKIVGEHVHLADTLGVELELSLESANVAGDLGLLERLVANLVENAIKHNLRDGWVRVTVVTEGGEAVLRIANSGAVLSHIEVDTLFEPFQRGPRLRRERPLGFGLGLTIVRAVAAVHNGRVDAFVLEGGGLEVTVRLPAAPEPPNPPSR